MNIKTTRATNQNISHSYKTNTYQKHNQEWPPLVLCHNALEQKQDCREVQICGMVPKQLQRLTINNQTRRWLADTRRFDEILANPQERCWFYKVINSKFQAAYVVENCKKTVFKQYSYIWEKLEIAWNHSHASYLSRNFSFLPNFTACFYNYNKGKCSRFLK